MSFCKYVTFILLGFAVMNTVEAKYFDKSSYHLFNPVPKDKMKDMSPDRPDKTEGPYTVDPGHFEFDIGIIDYAWDHDKNHGNDQKTRSLNLFGTEIRIGLINKLELQIILSGYNRVRTRDFFTGQTMKQHGYGDTFVRFKYNFWGNESQCKSKTAFGVIPFVKFATNQDHLGNRSTEQGISFPFDVKITDKLSFSCMAQVNASKGNGRGKRVAEFLQSAEFGYQFTDKLSGFVELFTDKSTAGGSKWIITGDYGFVYSLNDNVALDAAMFIGISKEAPDMEVTAGISFRI
ncbi:MAG TPA: transporter [Candidatus Nitrosotenuis sp.]|nr:transporter [Candidatus Nitrosotenuis sp.]